MKKISQESGFQICIRIVFHPTALTTKELYDQFVGDKMDSLHGVQLFATNEEQKMLVIELCNVAYACNEEAAAEVGKMLGALQPQLNEMDIAKEVDIMINIDSDQSMNSYFLPPDLIRAISSIRKFSGVYLDVFTERGFP